MMKARLKFYGPLIIVNLLSLTYLLFFLSYNWYVNNYPPPGQSLADMISQNPRWITWGVCASGLGLLLGFMAAIGLLIPVPDEEHDKEFIIDWTDKSLELFPGLRELSFFLGFLIIGLLVMSEGGWRIGLRNGLEVIGVFTWSLFLVTSLILVPTFLVDILYNKKSPLPIFKKVSTCLFF